MMEQQKFQEVIQSAIQREIDSVDFYTRASRVAKHSGTRELFLDFAKEEEGHRKLLENVHLGKIESLSLRSIPDLRISDYLADAGFKADMSYADILRMAIKREEYSVKLYTDLQEPNGDERLNKLFSFLVQEESNHKYTL